MPSARVLHLHPSHPQTRLIKQAQECLSSAGAVAVCPSDAAYLLICGFDDKEALARIQRWRELDREHPMTLLCADLSQVSRYAKIDNPAFRLLKKALPGPYTFILPATGDVPRRLLPKARTVGVRVSEHPVIQALLAERSEPLLGTTLRMPEDEQPLSEEDDIIERTQNAVDVVLLAGACGFETTSIIDLTSHPPVVRREGKGDLAVLGH